MQVRVAHREFDHEAAGGSAWLSLAECKLCPRYLITELASLATSLFDQVNWQAGTLHLPALMLQVMWFVVQDNRD